MTRTGKILVSAIAATGLLAAGCAKQEAPVAEEIAVVEEVAAEPMVAVARLQARKGLEITGTVSFIQAAPDQPVTIAAHIEGAAEGEHGFHVHDVGDCSAEDFTSAGGHFNPASVPHAGPQDAERHSGDLGNIVVGADGVGHLELTTDMLTVEDGPQSVAGRAVILHEKADDLVSQPTGAAGPRLACGVIEREG